MRTLILIFLLLLLAGCSSTEPSPCQVRDSSQYTTQDGYVVTVQLEVCP